LHKSKSEPVRRLEVFTRIGRRGAWTTDQKAQIVAESSEGEILVFQPTWIWNPLTFPDSVSACFKRAASLVQLSGRNSRNISMIGTSPRASVGYA